MALKIATFIAYIGGQHFGGEEAVKYTPFTISDTRH
jgi:hypothetical protein